MADNKIYIVMEHDVDPYAGSHFVAVYNTRQKAVDYIDSRLGEDNDEWSKERWYIVETELQ